MALRRWPTMLALAGMFAAACVVLSVALGDVLSQATAIKEIRQLRERHVVTFTPFHLRRGFEGTRFREDTIQHLINMIDRQEAYTAIVGNVSSIDPKFAYGGSVILFCGAAPDLFPELQPDEPATLPFAMRGAKLADQNIDSVRFAGESVPVVKTLPTGAIFFDPYAGVIPLDRRIVIRAPAKMISLLNLINLEPWELEEALHRAVMFAPADEEVDAFVSGLAQGGLKLVPHDVAVKQAQRFDEFLMVSAMYIVGMLSFLTLVFSAFVSSARLAMRQENRAFKIREMCGATPMHLSLRIGSFLAAVALVLPVALLSFLVVIGGHYAAAALWVMLAVFLSFILLWFTSVREVCHQDKIR